MNSNQPPWESNPPQQSPEEGAPQDGSQQQPQQQPPQQGQQPYPQGSQHMGQGPQQYGAPGGHPQQGYQMGPPPYYPPPKRGFPAWAIVLIVCAVALPIVGILGLAAIPLITSNTSDARRAEGEQMMGSARNMARVQFSKTNLVPRRLSDCGMDRFDREGMYYRVNDPIGGSGDTGIITCTPIQTTSDGQGKMTFAWNEGGGTITWQ